ncbi:MAG TPA: RNA polymerase sigma factor [Rhizomicrobium sp.]
MAEKPPDTSNENTNASQMGGPLAAARAKAWFVHEVLPLEAMLMHFLQKNWRNRSDLEDFRQDVYEHVLKAADSDIPERAKPFVFTIARNLLISRLRKESIVPIEIVSDLDMLGYAADEPGPDRNVFARDVLRRLQAALDHLPPRCREAIVLKRIEGLSQREIAQRMGISEQVVANYVAQGMCVLADMIYGEHIGSEM